MTIEADNIGWSIGKTQILDRVSLAATPGEVLGLLGPNGSGKSSLLRILAGLRKPQSGTVTLDGTDLAHLKRSAIARRVALVEQHASTEANVRVADVVKLGRIPHRLPLSGWTRADEFATSSALERVGMTARRAQSWQSLSGGERQRVHIARALAQTPTEMLLDEPTNHLDLRYQIETLDLVRDLADEHGVAVGIVLHDLDQAARVADTLLLLSAGRVHAAGDPIEVLTAENIAEVYEISVEVSVDPNTSRLRIDPVGRHSVRPSPRKDHP